MTGATIDEFGGVPGRSAVNSEGRLLFVGRPVSAFVRTGGGIDGGLSNALELLFSPKLPDLSPLLKFPFTAPPALAPDVTDSLSGLGAGLVLLLVGVNASFNLRAGDNAR